MVCSACSVNSIYSMNTCFMEEYDLPISLPQSISFADGRQIDYLYAASADPINLIDPTGMKVKAIGKREQQMIKNTIHSEDCNYVDFDSYGFLNLSLMQ